MEEILVIGGINDGSYVDGRVKTTVLGIRNLHVNEAISEMDLQHAKFAKAEDDLLYMTIRKASHKFLNAIEKYITCEFIRREDGSLIVHCELDLPYIHDDEIKDKERQIKNLEREKSELITAVLKLENWIKLPWYKKIWRRILQKRNLIRKEHEKD